jgi:hypothetical protein
VLSRSIIPTSLFVLFVDAVVIPPAGAAADLSVVVFHLLPLFELIGFLLLISSPSFSSLSTCDSWFVCEIVELL